MRSKIHTMNGRAVLRLALLGLVGALIQNTSAASAVASDGCGHMETVVAYSLRQAKDLALDRCRRRYGPNARIFAASDVVGYGAIAVGRLGTHSVVGVSLGRPSPADAENRAKVRCLKAGGIDPKVKWGWFG
jgi:hypothetical protein